MIIPALLAISAAPLYLLSTDMFWITIGVKVLRDQTGGRSTALIVDKLMQPPLSTTTAVAGTA